MSGLPRHIFPATPRAAAEYAARYGWITAALRGSSAYLCNPNGNPYGNPAQVGYPSVYQGFPTTASVMRQWIGNPGGVVDANVIGLYGCNTATPLLDSLGLGPNLVGGGPSGAPLTGRECVGLAQTGSLSSKVGVEFPTEGMLTTFADAGNVFMDVADGTVRSFLMVVRFNTRNTSPANRVLSKEGGNLWVLTVGGANLTLYGTAAYAQSAAVACAPWDNAWHFIAGVLDAVTPGAHVLRLFTDLGDAASAGFAGSLNNATSLSLGWAVGGCAAMQVGYMGFFDIALTSAMRVAFQRHAQMAIPFLHSRTNPLITRIGANRIACWSGGNVGQAAVGYDASLVSAALGNALGTGYCMEDAITWLGLGTTNQPAWVGTNATNTATDGPSSMRDSARVADADVANAGYVTSGAANLAGATNVPFQFAAWRQAVGGGGLNAVYRAYFTGDGGGPEELTWATDAGTVPAAWGRITGNCTPVGAGHTAVVVRIYPTDAVAGSVGTVDCYVEGGVQNRNFDWIAHRRCAAGATAATTPPSVTVVNTNNYVYNPLRGSETIIIGGFQGTSGAVFLGFGLAGAAGSLMLSYNAGQLILRIWDAAAALVAAINCGALNAARHQLTVDWDSVLGEMTVSEGGTVLGSALIAGGWTTPTAAVTPLGYGCDNSGANAGRCYLEAA